MLFGYPIFAVIGAIIAFAIFCCWMYFCVSVGQNQKAYPSLNRVANIGNMILIIAFLFIITKYNLWC